MENILNFDYTDELEVTPTHLTLVQPEPPHDDTGTSDTPDLFQQLDDFFDNTAIELNQLTDLQSDDLNEPQVKYLTQLYQHAGDLPLRRGIPLPLGLDRSRSIGHPRRSCFT